VTQKPVALVTGSREGIGRFLSRELALADYEVVGCSRKAPDWTCDNYTHVIADVASEADVKALMSEIRNRHGRLDAIINNAGVASMNHSLMTPAETIDRIMSVNFRGSFLVSREGAKLMRKRRFGRIVNISTVAVPLRLEGESVYVASKSAVEGLTRVMSRELAEFGITVNAVGPGPIETALIRGVAAPAIQNLIGRLAVRRLCRMEDVLHTIRFLIDSRSDYITGQVIYLGGV
jgi:3-oxoacyl-[acyl-carrier protein] reductase